MPALKGINETGFWESLDVVDLNDEALQAAGTRWDDFLPVPESWCRSPAARPYREKAVALLRSELARHPLLVLKDPRLYALISIWRPAIVEAGARPAFVHVLRHPLEVADSLRARDGFPTAKSLVLWLRSVLESERATRGEARSSISYQDLLEDWRRTVLKVARDLRLRWPRAPEQASAEVEAFLRPSLRHHKHADAEVSHPDVPRLVQEVYVALTTATTRGRSVSGVLDASYEELERADAVFGALLAHLRDASARGDDAVAALAQERADRTGRENAVAALREETEKLAKLVAEVSRARPLENALEIGRAEAARLQTRLDETERRLAAERGAREEWERAVATARQERGELMAENATLVTRAERAEQQARELSRSLAVRDFGIRRLERQVHALARRAQDVEAGQRRDYEAILRALDATAS